MGKEVDDNDNDEHRYVFMGEPYRRTSAGAYYDHLHIEIVDEEPVDVFRNFPVVLQSPNELLPYIACIKEMWVDAHGEKWFKAAWYFRTSDVHPKHVKCVPTEMLPNELFLSAHMDKNCVRSIVDMCAVHNVEEDFPRSKVRANNRVFYCRYMYVPKSKKPFKAVKKGSYTDRAEFNVRQFSGHCIQFQAGLTPHFLIDTTGDWHS